MLSQDSFFTETQISFLYLEKTAISAHEDKCIYLLYSEDHGIGQLGWMNSRQRCYTMKNVVPKWDKDWRDHQC